jgi:hypothetical protein
MLMEPNCRKRNCVHFEGVKWLGKEESSEVVYCKAFPNGIPGGIAYGEDKHLEVHPDQKNKVIFESK